MPRKKDDWTGIHKHYSRIGGTHGWRAVVSGGSRDAKPIRQWFPLNTPVAVMQKWRERVQAERLVHPPKSISRTGFAQDAAAYLRHPDIVNMPTFADRQRQIQHWIDAFRSTPRADITAQMIRTLRNQWATTPRSADDRRPLSASTINQRTRALSNLWTILDGRQAYNPVKEVDELTPPAPVARDIDRKSLQKILAAFANVGVAKRGEKRPTGNKTLARIRVMALTGLPSGTLKQLTPADVDLKKRLLYRPARKKGAGQGRSIQPLTKDAVAAFKAFAKLNCWGPFSHHSLRKSLLRAAKNAGITRHIRPYDLRHTFLTELAKASKDEVAVMEIAQHANISTTRRYTGGSVSHRTIEAVKAYERSARR